MTSHRDQRLLTRRDLLKLVGMGASALLLRPEPAYASSRAETDNTMAMLYDATRCVGCRACEEACKTWNELPPDAEPPSDLTAHNFTLIKQYQAGGSELFRKYQCMHCVHPACVSACPVQALTKREDGPVVYDANKCIGCRYCMVACPFQVPRIDWNEVLPVIAKCTFCADRIADGLTPACAAACPVGALTFGTRKQILEEARSRIEQHAGQYIDHIYGETEAGGTSWMYISPVRFEKLGLPVLGSKPVPALSDNVAIYGTPSLLVGVGALLGGAYWVTKGRAEQETATPGVEGQEES
jgi:formate dehydrogenase iron-sulfur subunit